MQVRTVDPTDNHHTFDAPAYRVYFWKRPVVATLPEGIREEQMLYTSWEYELTECHNVREAIAWADENVGAGRTYTLYARIELGDRRVMIRLFGIDPTINTGDRKLAWPGEMYT